MKPLSILVAVVLLFCVAIYAQNGYPNLTNTVQTRPQAIPTSLTDVIKQDAYVCYSDFTDNGQNLLIQDRQATPIPWINAVLGSSGTITTWIYTAYYGNCRWFPNGISIQAGGAGATGYMTISCPTRCVLTWGF